MCSSEGLAHGRLGRGRNNNDHNNNILITVFPFLYSVLRSNRKHIGIGIGSVSGANRQHYSLVMLNYETQLTRSNRKHIGIGIGSVSLIVNLQLGDAELRDATHEVEPKAHTGVSGSRYTICVWLRSTAYRQLKWAVFRWLSTTPALAYSYRQVRGLWSPPIERRETRPTA